jgi:serine/threonine-protein kinase RIO1
MNIEHALKNLQKNIESDLNTLHNSNQLDEFNGLTYQQKEANLYIALEDIDEALLTKNKSLMQEVFFRYNQK